MPALFAGPEPDPIPKYSGFLTDNYVAFNGLKGK
jgi:hypothetical protein